MKNNTSVSAGSSATPHLPSGHLLPLRGEELEAAVVCPLAPQGERVGVRGGERTITFHASGMHCRACVLMIECELGEVSGVQSVRVSLKHNSVEVSGDFGGKTDEELAAEFSELLKERGYTLSVEKQAATKNWGDFKTALPLALGVAVLFVLLQNTGLINLAGGHSMSYSTAFVVGIIASLSSCMAVVGGLLLSMSATFAREGDRIRPQVLFHAGRLVSFFVFGGVIGALGAAFTLSPVASLVLGLVVGVVMLVLGINLLDVFHFAKRFQPAMPQFLSRRALGVSQMNHTLTPLLVGIATFFLPCGFTQSMQLYTLTTGHFLTGAFTMLSFALGTLPVLALISFSSFSIQNSAKAGIFFKTAGLIVIMFALFNILNSLVAAGILPPLFTI